MNVILALMFLLRELYENEGSTRWPNTHDVTGTSSRTSCRRRPRRTGEFPWSRELIYWHLWLQGQRPEALKEEPYSVTDSLFQLLLEIATRAASNGVNGGIGSKNEANGALHHGSHQPRLVASYSSTSIPHHPTGYGGASTTTNKTCDVS